MRLLIINVFVAAIVATACQRETVAPSAATTATASTPNGAAVVPAAGVPAAPKPAPPAPVREVTLPTGTALSVILEDAVGSDTSRVEQPVRAHLAVAVAVRGETVIPEGSRVSGVVTAATPSAKVKGRARIAVRFDTLVPRGDDERYALSTGTFSRLAPATKKDDALKVGLPAAGGAIIGGLLGGKKGALIGTAAGGGAGAAVVLSTRGEEVRLPKGTALTLRLSQPLTVRVRGS